MFNKILVANRGEIALRVIRACHDLGIKTVAVYSEADRRALHVRMADHAVCLGDPKPSESYLNIDKILEAAKKLGADAIHPGYGFLSENAAFARACKDSSIVFIGPSAEAIAAMGDKVQARNAAVKAGAPVIPGSLKELNDPQSLKAEAAEMGYPVMLKAVGGGGGKGIRIVNSEPELGKSFEMARNEATKSFGNPGIYLEKYLVEPRHIEIQLLGDMHGNMVHFGERECSIQRNHQKIIEECPSPVVSSELRQKMGQDAIRIAKTIGYYNAGTIEFLVDKDMNYYFLEMNTRLQVEHTITEEVYGINFVREQIKIAAGERLDFTQQGIQPNGHAIEVRICAEDPQHNFAPSVGIITHLQTPSGRKVRLDSALYPGMEINLYYDPMVAKLIVWGRERQFAISRMITALREFEVDGIRTNIPYLLSILKDKTFGQGEYSTAFLGNFCWETKELDADSREIFAMAAALKAFHESVSPPTEAETYKPSDSARQVSNWQRCGMCRRLKKC